MGTIAEKLTYLNGTKQDLKQAINNLGGDITSSTTFRNYATELNNIYDNLPKVSDTGTNVSLSPTLKGRLGIVPKGNTYQDGEPTPETPVEIQSATGTQKVVVSGKNLFDDIQIGKVWNTYDDNDRAVVYGKVKSNTTYTISFSNLSSVDGLYLFEKVNKTDTTTIGDRTQITNTTTITTTATTNYIGIQVNKNNVTLSDVEGLKLQLEKGSTATPYQPYQEPQEVDIELGNIEPNKINDYEDYIDGTPDNWVLYKNIGKVVLNGSETWGTIGNDRYYITITDKRSLTTAVTCCLYSNYFNETTNAGDTTNIGQFTEGYYTTGNQTVRFNYNGSNNDLAGFKTWLSTHNTEVLYVLATPTETPITDENLISQLNELYYLMSNDDTTNIDVTGNLPMRITASAIKGA